MAKNTQPIAKRCKALGISPAVMGYAKKNTTRNSNGNVRKKQSEYASQLKEKQKVKFIYGVLEKQCHNAYQRAEARPGKTGENLLQIMECRLDNVVFRLGLNNIAVQILAHKFHSVGMIRQESLWLPDNIHCFMRSEVYIPQISIFPRTCQGGKWWKQKNLQVLPMKR